MTIYRLADWKGETPAPRDRDYWTAEHCVRARAELILNGFKYDGSTGTEYENGTWVARYSSPDDWEPFDDTQEAADFVFEREIRARAARLANRERVKGGAE